MPDYNFITTYTGKKFHYLNPSLGEVDIIDIAHHLSLKCRFIGACKQFYSVAEHCVRVSYILSPELQLSGLLHDATEAYIPDIPRPIKIHFGLRVVEDVIFKTEKELDIHKRHWCIPRQKAMQSKTRQKVASGVCPECGSTLWYQEGCVTCPSCGYSKC